jgi:hypothetical protein
MTCRCEAATGAGPLAMLVQLGKHQLQSNLVDLSACNQNVSNTQSAQAGRSSRLLCSRCFSSPMSITSWSFSVSASRRKLHHQWCVQPHAGPAHRQPTLPFVDQLLISAIFCLCCWLPCCFPCRFCSTTVLSEDMHLMLPLLTRSSVLCLSCLLLGILPHSFQVVSKIISSARSPNQASTHASHVAFCVPAPLCLLCAAYRTAFPAGCVLHHQRCAQPQPGHHTCISSCLLLVSSSLLCLTCLCR